MIEKFVQMNKHWQTVKEVEKEIFDNKSGRMKWKR